jgi:ligand-binding sensor domain-containing protein
VQLRWDGTSFTTYKTAQGLPNNNVNDIKIDAAGNIWVATYGGLAKYNGSSWTTFTTSNSSIAHNQVYAIAIENSTTMWIGTAGGLM